MAIDNRNLETIATVNATQAAAFLESSEEVFRTVVATNPNLTAEQVEQLLADKSAKVRAALAGRADLTAEQIMRLAQDKAVTVREAVASRPRVAVEVRDRRAGHDSEKRRVAPLPEESVVLLAGDTSRTVRRALLDRNREALSDAALEALLSAGEVDIASRAELQIGQARVIAALEKAPEDALFSGSPSWFSPEMGAALRQSTKPGVRYHGISNTGIESINDEEPRVRLAAAKRAIRAGYTREPAVWRIFKQDGPKEMLYLLHQSHAPNDDDLLREIVETLSVEDKARLARHSNRAVRQLLALEQDDTIRTAAERANAEEDLDLKVEQMFGKNLEEDEHQAFEAFAIALEKFTDEQLKDLAEHTNSLVQLGAKGEIRHRGRLHRSQH